MVGDSRCARFLGEDDDQHIDGRKLRGLAHPDVYRQWVDYWRQEFSKGIGDASQLSGSHYRMIDGGEVSDIAGDDCYDVAAYLFPLLVAQGGLREALETESELRESVPAPLESEVVKAFRGLDILGEPTLYIPHPVRRNATVRGKSVEYSAAFVQNNGRLCVMETVDFTSRQKRTSRDHAGWSAYLFNDVVGCNPTSVDPVAIVSVNDEDLESADVEIGMALLKRESRVVRWNEAKQRQEFLEERRAAAFSA
jgi:hypothetical protein